MVPVRFINVFNKGIPLIFPKVHSVALFLWGHGTIPEIIFKTNAISRSHEKEITNFASFQKWLK